MRILTSSPLSRNATSGVVGSEIPITSTLGRSAGVAEISVPTNASVATDQRCAAVQGRIHPIG
jgi:hypothetical protein